MTMNQEILKYVHQYFPQLAEKGLREEIAEVGKVMEFKAGSTIMDFGAYIRLVPLVLKGSIKVTREDEEEDYELLLYYLTAGDTCSMSF